MRRVALALFSTVAGLVMLLSFKTHSAGVAGVPVAAAPVLPGADTSGAPSDSSGAASANAPTSSGNAAAPSSSAAAPSNSAPATSSSAPATSKTITGDPIDTRYGPVQVQITVRSGTLTAVDAIVYPQDTPRDEQINAYAIPALNQEALSARSAQIDMVSGATYTSQGYIGSLQSALDMAGL